MRNYHYLFFLFFLIGCAPKTCQEYYEKAQRLEAKYKHHKTYKVYKKALAYKLDTNTVETHLKIAENFYGYPDNELRQLYRFKIGLDSNNIKYWLLLADTYYNEIHDSLFSKVKKEKVDTAIYLYDKAIQLDSTAFDTYHKKAILILRASNYIGAYEESEAVRCFKKACELGSADACNYLFNKKEASFAYQYLKEGKEYYGIKDVPSIKIQLRQLEQNISDIDLKLLKAPENPQLYYQKAFYHNRYLLPKYKLFVDEALLGTHYLKAKKAMNRACELGYQRACVFSK